MVRIWYGDGQIILPKKTLVEAYRDYQEWAKDPHRAAQDREDKLIQKHAKNSNKAPAIFDAGTALGDLESAKSNEADRLL